MFFSRILRLDDISIFHNRFDCRMLDLQTILQDRLGILGLCYRFIGKQSELIAIAKSTLYVIDLK